MPAEPPTERTAFAEIGRAAAVAVLFCVVAYLSIELTRYGGRIAAVWPANAVMLALLLRASSRNWPAYLVAGYIGNYAANVMAGDANLVALALGFCNTAEIAIAVYVFRRLVAFTPENISSEIAKPRVLLSLAAVAGVLAPIVSASMAVVILNVANGVPMLAVWPVWFMADALGMMIVAPLLIALNLKAIGELFANRKSTAITLTTLALVGVVTFGVFWQSSYPLLFLVFAVMVLPKFRLGFSGATMACFLVAAIAILLTVSGHGPLMLTRDGNVQERVFFLQIFILSISVTALPTAAAIRARQTAEQRLAQALNLKQAIFDSADFSIIATRRDGVITHFNRGAARMLGYAADEMVGKQTPAIIHQGDEVVARAAELTEELGRSIAPGFEVFVAKTDQGPDEREWTYVRKDGGRVPVRLSVTALKGPTGRIEGYLGIAKDLTEERAMNERLEQSRRDLRHIIDGIPAMVAYWDADLRNRFANIAYIDWFGWSPDDLYGKHISDLLGPELFERNRPSMEAALRGEPQTFERELIANDGRRRFSQAHYVPDFREGKAVGFYVLVFDISQLKNSEAALKQAIEVAENATRAKSDFLAAMSHELRTPMNSILGFSDLLLTQRVGTLDPKQLDFTRQIKISGEHLLRLINDVLELSKIEAGKMSLSIEPVALAPVVKSVAASLRPLAEKAGIELREKYFGPEIPEVQADSTRLGQVLINLGSNAIKYNRIGGYVEFSSERRGEDRLRILVKDNGNGIPVDRQHELFQAFNRLGAEQSAIEGTGIGLTLTKKLVEMMHGEVGFASKEGEGSTFWVDLPVDKTGRREVQALAEVEEAVDIPEVPEGLAILYMEDNEGNRLLMRNYMALLPNVELMLASDGRSGLEMAKKRRPDLILIDINMPILNGFEVLERLRADPETAKIPAVALTASALNTDVERGLKAGFVRYLKKPVRLKELLDTISTLVIKKAA